MKTTIEIDDDVLDGLIRSSLKQSIDLLKQSIKELKGRKNLKPFQKEDLAEAIISLDALEKTYDYYGGNLQ